MRNVAAVVAGIMLIAGSGAEGAMILRYRDGVMPNFHARVLPLFASNVVESWDLVNGPQTASAAVTSTVRTLRWQPETALAAVGSSSWSEPIDAPSPASLATSLAMTGRSTGVSLVSFGATLTERLSDNALLGSTTVVR
jgi:hypothetical protein